MKRYSVRKSRKLKKLEKQMYEHSRNLEFEEAAKVRDDIERIKQLAMVG